MLFANEVFKIIKIINTFQLAIEHSIAKYEQ